MENGDDVLMDGTTYVGAPTYVENQSSKIAPTRANAEEEDKKKAPKIRSS